MDAATQSAVIERLQGMNLIPIRAAELAGNSNAAVGQNAPKAASLFSRGKVSQPDLGNMTRELATLLRAGLPLDRSFEILINLAEKKPVADLLNEIRNEVRGGASLSKALDQHRDIFSRFYINMVKAGEVGGALGNVLQRLADHMERAKELKRVRVEVDPELEITEIVTRVVNKEGPALIFEKVKGSPYPMAINLFGSARRVEMALGKAPAQLGQCPRPY